jgi:ABC-type transporter Mla subunit MlaD
VVRTDAHGKLEAMIRRPRYVTHDELDHRLAEINERIEQMSASQQGDIDALTAEVDQVSADLAASSTELQAEIDALAHANPTLNLDALKAAVAPVDAAVQALGKLTPTP